MRSKLLRMDQFKCEVYGLNTLQRSGHRLVPCPRIIGGSPAMRAQILIACAVSVVLTVSFATASQAMQRGAAGTATRINYCSDKYISCINNVASSCQVGHPAGTPGYAPCYDGGKAACESSWGDSSGCLTDEIVTTKPITKTSPAKALP